MKKTPRCTHGDKGGEFGEKRRIRTDLHRSIHGFQCAYPLSQFLHCYRFGGLGCFFLQAMLFSFAASELTD